MRPIEFKIPDGRMAFRDVHEHIDVRLQETVKARLAGDLARAERMLWEAHNLGPRVLPVLYALEEDSPAGEELRGMLTGPLTSDAEVARALELIGQTDGRERSLTTVRGYLTTVEAELAGLPESPAKDALLQLSRFTVSRVG